MRKTLLAALAMGFAVTMTLSQVIAPPATTAPGQALVDNPQYQNWAKYKVGSMQKTSMTQSIKAEGQDMNNTGSITFTLKELTPDKAVVEMVQEISIGGQSTTVPTRMMEFKAKVPVTATQPVAPEGGKVTRTGSGDEELTVGGKKYMCHWEEWQMESPEGKMTSKVWTSKDVPGGVVKTESSGDMQGVKMTAKTELVEFKSGA